MRIQVRSLTLSDFGPLAGENTVSFSGHGTFAICAPNGKGKSHVIAGLRSLVAPGAAMDKPLGSYVHGYGLAGTKSAKSEGRFLVEGKELVIKRSITLKPAKEEELQQALSSGNVPQASSKLSVSFDGKDIKATADAIEFIESIFDIRNTVQEDAVFVMQGHAGDMLRTTPANRAKALQFLCGADICQRAVEVAQQRMSLLHVVDRSEDIKDKLAWVNTCAKDLESVLNETEALKPLMKTKEEQDALHARIEEHGLVKDRKDTVEQAAARVKELSEKVNAANAEVTTVGLQVARIEDKWTPDKRTLVNNGKAALINAMSAMKMRDQYLSAQKLIAKLEAERAGRQAPVPPAYSQMEFASIEEMAPKLLEEINQHMKVVTAFEASDKCPTCGCKPEDKAKLIAESMSELESLQPDYEFAITEIKRIKTAVADYDTKKIGFDRWSSGLDAQIQSLKDQLAGFDTQMVIPELSEVSELVADFDADMKTLEQLTQAGRQHERVRDKLAGELDTWKENATKEYNAEGLLTAEELEEIDKTLTLAREIEKKFSSLEGHASAMQKSFDTAVKELERMQEQQSIVASKLQQVEFLEGLKTCLHHTAIPHDRAAAYIGHINGLMEEYCRIMHAPFTVFIHPEHHTFMAAFEDQVVPVYQLSGGQTTMASWAWHLALYQKHGSQVGFIVMDEPTMGLDETNLSNVAETVENLGAHCHGAGLQFIMVTHERDMAQVFDNIEELSHN